jgi:predicted metal-dependent phosphoesterase TrpH
MRRAGGGRDGFRIDLHVHTAHSGDNRAEPQEVLECAIAAGLDGIAFTEHYSYAASSFADRMRERDGARILVLRGVEISTEEGHCLVFGVDTDPLGLGFAPLREVVRAVAAAGGVAIPSHPYRPGSGVGELVRTVPGLTAIEGCNGVNMRAMNERAMATAAALGLPTTGGSDAHVPSEVGACYTLFEEPVTAEGFVDRLRAGRYRGVDTRAVSAARLPAIW